MYEAMKQMPEDQFIYYADTDHVPYGIRTSEEIYCFTRRAMDFLMDKGAEILVIACNTATSVAIARLREELNIPIVGMEPAIKPAVIRYPEHKILVCATPMTIEGDKLHRLLESEHASSDNVDLLPLPDLVKWAEQGIFDPKTIVPYLWEKIQSQNYTAVVLGCTHFTLFRDSFRQLLGDRIIFIDGTTGTVNRIKTLANEIPTAAEPQTAAKVRYFQSGREVKDKDTLTFIQNIYNRQTILDEYIKI
ncbi:MAG: glutamate racemase [Clostridia bacterium]|nr:glutamate racemase [Clostridia bacterium]